MRAAIRKKLKAAKIIPREPGEVIERKHKEKPLPLRIRHNQELLTDLSKIVSREEMRQALDAQAVLNDKFNTFLTHLFDPSYRNRSIPTIARMCDIRYIELLEILRQYHLTAGLVRMSRHVGDVLEDTAIDAKSQLTICPACNATGLLKGRQCMQCQGQGLVRTPGDATSRKLIFESQGLTKSAVSVDARSVNLAVPNEKLEDILKSARPSLSQLNTIEGEVVEEKK